MFVSSKISADKTKYLSYFFFSFESKPSIVFNLSEYLSCGNILIKISFEILLENNLYILLSVSIFFNSSNILSLEILFNPLIYCLIVTRGSQASSALAARVALVQGGLREHEGSRT